MTKIKHDMKNTISCIGELALNNENKKIQNICNDYINKMDEVYTPVNTNNPLLNAVINVEIEKAKNKNIDLRLILMILCWIIKIIVT